LVGQITEHREQWASRCGRDRHRGRAPELAGAGTVEIGRWGALRTISAGCGSLAHSAATGATQKPAAGAGGRGFRLGPCDTSTVMSTAVHNCTRDEGGPFEFGNKVLISSHRKLLRLNVVVVSVAETPGR
jgi:hypothetical protein